MAAIEVLRTYKSLSNLERNCVPHPKSVDVEIRPIRHCLADRMRTHAFICMVGAHLTWHQRRAWAPLCFTDERPLERADTVALAKRSQAASSNAARRVQPDRTALPTFQGLLDHVATLTGTTNQARAPRLRSIGSLYPRASRQRPSSSSGSQSPYASCSHDDHRQTRHPRSMAVITRLASVTSV